MVEAYHPVLGRTPREELAHPGWRIARGHLIWAGTDPHDYHTSIKFIPLSEYESVNNDIIYYLERGLSLSDSVDAAIRTGMAQLRAAAFIAAGIPELASMELERAEARDMRLIEAELTADRLAIQRALHAGVRRSPRPRPIQAVGWATSARVS